MSPNPLPFVVRGAVVPSRLGRLRVVLVAAAMLGLLARPSPARAGADAVTLTQIEIVVNIPSVKGPDGVAPLITRAEAQKAIDRANEILKQAKIRLEVADFHDGPKDPFANAGNADADGKMTEKDVKDAKKAGGKELDKRFKDEDGEPSGKGMKLYFAVSVPPPPPDTKSSSGGATSGGSGHGDGSTGDTAGRSEHRNRTIFVEPAPAEGDVEVNPERFDPDDDAPLPVQIARGVTGERIAHEVIHALSVSAHVETSVDDKNIMNPVIDGDEPPKDSIDAKHVKEIQDQAKRWGNPAPPDTPGTKQETGGKQDEHKTDAQDASGPDETDISFCGLYSTEGSPGVTIQALMAGYGATGIDATYRWLFDVDGDPFTGLFVAGVPGIEREVVVHAIGDGASPFVDAGLVDHMLGGLFVPIDGAIVDIEPVFDRGGVLREPIAQRVQLDVEKPLLGLVADSVPVTMLTEFDGGVPSDELAFSFDRVHYADRPALTPSPQFVRPGDLVEVEAFGLTPGASARLLLDEDVLASDLPVLGDGSVATSFVLCAMPVADRHFFLTVADDAGVSAFGALNVDPWVEEFEAYPGGSQLHGVGGWAGWDDDPAFSAPVTSGQGHGSDQSVVVSGAADLVREHCASDRGMWSYSAWQYIPAGFTSGGGGSLDGSYFILLNTYQVGVHEPHDWSVQIQIDSNDGMMKVFHGDGTNTIGVPYETDRWVKIQAIIDLDDDWTRIYYDDELVTEYPWTGGVLGDGGGALDVAAVDLFANGSTSIYYDDLTLEPISGCGGRLDSDADRDGRDLLAEFLAGTDPCEGE